MSLRKPKYRQLSTDELQELEKEFVHYLIVNGITAEDWGRLKEDELEKAEDILTLFSDVVLEGVLRKINFLEFRSNNDIKVFQCLKDKIVMVGLTSDNPEIDFTRQDIINNAGTISPKGLKAYTLSKSYQKPREEELFHLISNGCQISDSKLFKSISLALMNLNIGE
jgi:hypothetical protein